MSKRFSATELWDEDWFLDMPNEYKLFWFYMLSTCDHAGFYKVNLKRFMAINNVKISAEKALALFNFGKCRIRPLKEGFWFVEDFIVFQYGHKLNKKNRLHLSVVDLLNKFKIKTSSIRGLEEVSEGST